MSPEPAAPGDATAFDRITTPLLASLRGLIEDTVRVRDQYHWMPSEDSPAMAELAAEPRVSGEWRNRPVSEAHHHGGLLLLAAEDHAAALCRLLEHPEPCVFAHVPVARAALEACARSDWMSAPHVGAHGRVARYMSECLQSDYELRDYSGSEVMTRRRAEIVAEATRLGLRTVPNKGRVPSIAERRPGSTEAVRQLFTAPGPGDLIPERSDLGRAVYNLYSATSHGTLYALRGSLRTLNESRRGAAEAAGWAAPQEGHVIGGLIVGADDVGLVVAAVTEGYILATTTYRTLMGWFTTDWGRHAINAHKLIQRALEDGERRGAPVQSAPDHSAPERGRGRRPA